MSKRRISGRKTTAEPRADPAKRSFPWHSNWKNDLFSCSHCGWKGLGAEAFPDELGMMECPRCDHGVGYAEFPSPRDAKKAAAEGNEERQFELMDFYWYSGRISEAASKTSGTTTSMSVSFVR
jgi:hypothetical protein